VCVYMPYGIYISLAAIASALQLLLSCGVCRCLSCVVCVQCDVIADSRAEYRGGDVEPHGICSLGIPASAAGGGRCSYCVEPALGVLVLT